MLNPPPKRMLAVYTCILIVELTKIAGGINNYSSRSNNKQSSLFSLMGSLDSVGLNLKSSPATLLAVLPSDEFE